MSRTKLTIHPKYSPNGRDSVVWAAISYPDRSNDPTVSAGVCMRRGCPPQMLVGEAGVARGCPPFLDEKADHSVVTVNVDLIRLLYAVHEMCGDGVLPADEGFWLAARSLDFEIEEE